MAAEPIESPDLDTIWREHSDELLVRCAAWMGGRCDDAQEAVSRAWMRAAANLIERRPILGNPRAWLFTLAYRVCMDIHRERMRRAEEELDAGSIVFASPRDPERTLLGKELARLFRRSIAELPPRLRGALQTYMTSGDYGEVIARFGITEANARKRIQQARAILRRRWNDYRARPEGMWRTIR